MATESGQSILLRVDIPEANSTKTTRVNLQSDTVGSVRQAVMKKFFLPAGKDANEFRLFHPVLNEFLDDAKLVSEYGLENNSSLFLKTEGFYAGPSGAYDRSLGALFGISLAEATRKSGGSLDYPVLVEKVIQTLSYRGLEKEGIFRLSGAASQIAKLKERFDQGEDVNLEEVPDPHVVSGLLKLYLRELPEPLLTYDLYDALVAANNTLSQAKRLSYLRATISVLPKCNFALLHRLCGFLYQISQKASVNKMALENLATVFGPNIMKKQGESVIEMVKNTAVVNSVTNDLIKHYKEVFEHTGEKEYLAIAAVQYDYKATNSAELNLAENEIIFVTKTDSTDGWWEGELHGKPGLFPQNYVKIIRSLEDSPSRSLSGNNLNAGGGAEGEDAKQNPQLLDEIAALNKKLARESAQRKEAEAIVTMLVNSFSELQKKVGALESANQSLRNEVLRLQGLASGGGGSST